MDIKQQREIRQEINFLKQAIQAKKVRTDLELSPEDRIRHLEQANYWLRRLITDQAED